MQTRNEEELLRQFSASNDQRAFEELVSRHATFVFNICRRILADRQDAEDAAQAVFLTLALKAKSLKNRKTVAPWLFQVAWHVALRAHDASQLRALREREAAALKTEQSKINSNGQSVMSAVNEVCSALPEKFLQPVVLHYYQGCSEAEGARQLGLKLGTFSSRLNRAREMLRTRLAARGIAYSNIAILQQIAHDASMTAPTGLASAAAKIAMLSKSSEAAMAEAASEPTLRLAHSALRMLWGKQLKAAAAIAACAAFALLSGILFTTYAVRSHAPALTPDQPIAVTKGGSSEPVVAPPPFVRVLGAGAFQPDGNTSAVAFSDDEKYLAACGERFVSVWDLSTSTMIARASLTLYAWDLKFISNDTLVIAPDGVWNPVNFMVWNWRKELKPAMLEVPNFALPSAATPPPRCFLSGRLMALFPNRDIALAPGGTANGGELIAVNLCNGREIPSIADVSRKAENIEYDIEAIAVSSDGSQLACVDRACGWSGDAGTAMKDHNSARFTIWDWKTRKQRNTWTKNAQYIEGLQWLAGNTELIVSAIGPWDNRSARVFRASDGAEIRSFPGVGVLSANGKTVTTFYDDAIRQFSMSDGKELETFKTGKFKFASRPVLSSTGRYFALLLNGANFLVADVKNRRLLAPSETSHRNQPYCMQYAADGRLVLYDGDQTRIYDDKGNGSGTLKSAMYRSGANYLSHDGRILVAQGIQDYGQADVWDTYTAKLLGNLGKDSNAVNCIMISDDDNWAMLGYEYNGRVRFFDLLHGTALGELNGPVHSQEVERCIWSRDGKTVFVADRGAMFIDDNELKKRNINPPIGLSGAFDPFTGTRKFWFKSADGRPIQCISELTINSAQDMIFVLQQKLFGQPSPALVNAVDGSFLRSVENPGAGARFTDDGKRIAGEMGVVDVASGKYLLKFGQPGKRLVSPSRTQMAQLYNGAIQIYDLRTGALVWRCNPGNSALTDEAHAWAWHPGEWQVTVSPKEGVAIEQIDLFANSVADRGGDASSETGVRKVLKLPDINARQAGIQSLVDTAQQSMQPLMKIVQSPLVSSDVLNDGEMTIRRLAVLSLERIARERAKMTEVLAFLKNPGVSLDPICLEFVQDAVVRLTAVQRAQELTRGMKKMEPLSWPRARSEQLSDF